MYQYLLSLKQGQLFKSGLSLTLEKFMVIVVPKCILKICPKPNQATIRSMVQTDVKHFLFIFVLFQMSSVALFSSFNTHNTLISVAVEHRLKCNRERTVGSSLFSHVMRELFTFKTEELNV